MFVSALALFRAHVGGAKTEAGDIAELETRVGELERRADQVDLLITALSGKVELLPAMKEQLVGLDRLLTTRLDTVDKAIEKVADKLERISDEPRSFRSPHPGS